MKQPLRWISRVSSPSSQRTATLILGQHGAGDLLRHRPGRLPTGRPRLRPKGKPGSTPSHWQVSRKIAYSTVWEIVAWAGQPDRIVKMGGVYIPGGDCCINGSGASMVPSTILLDDRIGLRATPFQHPIEQLSGKRSFSCLSPIAFRSQATAEGLFKSGEGVLGPTLIVVT